MLRTLVLLPIAWAGLAVAPVRAEASPACAAAAPITRPTESRPTLLLGVGLVAIALAHRRRAGH